MTRRQAVSNVRSRLKLLSTDILISDRYLYNELLVISLTFIKQNTDKRRLFQSPNIFTHLSCLEMLSVPIGECCEFTSPLLISKSKERLPKIAEGIFGLLVQNCVSIDNLHSFKESTPRRFANALKLGLKTNIDCFWIQDGHLYCSNGSLEAINFSALFEEDVPNSLLCPQDCDCKPKGDCDPCINPLDLPFRCPGYLEQGVIDETCKKLMGQFLLIKADETSNNLDETKRQG